MPTIHSKACQPLYSITHHAKSDCCPPSLECEAHHGTSPYSTMACIAPLLLSTMTKAQPPKGPAVSNPKHYFEILSRFAMLEIIIFDIICRNFFVGSILHL